MASHSGKRHRRRWLSVLAGVWVLAAGAGATSGGRESIVYYQVVYTNRTIRDLAAVPADNRGIRRVIRISRVEPPRGGAVIYSVDDYGIGYADPGRTLRDELHWNGKAWVLEEGPKTPTTSRPARPPVATAERRQRAIARLQERLKAERRKLKVAEQAVVQAAEMLTKAKGTGTEQAAMLLLEKAQAERQQDLTRILQLEALLSALKGEPVVGSAGAAIPVQARRPAGGLLGPAGPLTQRRILPQRVQVWKLPPGSGRRTYQASMAHVEAGTLGGFHYVACADTDGDGAPDRLIARSPLAVAEQAGGWTAWSFTTDEKAVFVGNTWRRADAVHYFARSPRRDARGAHTEVFVSGFPGGLPRYAWPHPYLTSLYVRVADQHPE